MVLDLNKLKAAKPSQAMTAVMGWQTRAEVYQPPNVPGVLVPVLTVTTVDTEQNEQTISLPPDMVVPFIAALSGWAASMMGGSAPQTPVEDGSDA